MAIASRPRGRSGPARPTSSDSSAPPEPQPLFVALAWIEAHDVIPDGFRAGEPFALYEYQQRYLANFYLVRPGVAWIPTNPILGPAFVNSRGLLVGPQGIGKNPLIAAQITLEGVGPALFAGFAGVDEGYACADHGCRCGWEYPYEPGEPRGMRWPTPLIQITAFSQDSTDNTYDALRPMIELGPLVDVIPKTGEQFIRLPGGGRIDTVTSSDQSRLGQRATFVPQDELGLWIPTNRMDRLADTQYRNLSKMGGRASLTTNAWDPSQHSVAQREFESSAADVYRQFVQPPKSLSFTNKAERRRIYRIVYAETVREHGGHVDLDSIEAEAVKIMGHDLPQARRFYGNELVSGAGRAFDSQHWADRAAKGEPTCAHTMIAIGFDGSRVDDHTSMIATCLACGYQWPLGIWRPADHGGEIPSSVVTATLEQSIADHTVVRVYADPPRWDETIAGWAGRWGQATPGSATLERLIVPWETNRPKQMGAATRSWHAAIELGAMSHCPITHPLCALFTAHVENAFRHDTGYLDEDRIPLWYATKERPMSPAKIDSVPAAVLSWEARNDAIAAGVTQPPEPSIYESRGFRILRRRVLTCPDCGRDTVVERRDKPGWRCPALEGGCNQVFEPNDERLLDQLAEAAPV